MGYQLHNMQRKAWLVWGGGAFRMLRRSILVSGTRPETSGYNHPRARKDGVRWRGAWHAG